MPLTFQLQLITPVKRQEIIQNLNLPPDAPPPNPTAVHPNTPLAINNAQIVPGTACKSLPLLPLHSIYSIYYFSAISYVNISTSPTFVHS